VAVDQGLRTEPEAAMINMKESAVRSSDCGNIAM
jgi:hypothetical protein